MRKLINPMGVPKRKFSMVHSPVTPPGAILLGAVSAVTAVAYTAAPAVINAASIKIPLRPAAFAIVTVLLSESQL